MSLSPIQEEFLFRKMKTFYDSRFGCFSAETKIYFTQVSACFVDINQSEISMDLKTACHDVNCWRDENPLNEVIAILD